MEKFEEELAHIEDQFSDLLDRWYLYQKELAKHKKKYVRDRGLPILERKKEKLKNKLKWRFKELMDYASVIEFHLQPLTSQEMKEACDDGAI